MNDDLSTGIDYVKSMDGTVISYSVSGEGPGLAIIHGSFRASHHYMRLVEELAGSFTVYAVDRRGRGGSGPQGSGYCLKKECEDIIAVLQKHDIKYLFGHSYGGFISLNTALEYPLAKLAVYEAPVSVDGSVPVAWLPRFEKELREEAYIEAFVTFMKGLKMGGAVSKLPRVVLTKIFGLMSQKPEWGETSRLMHTIPSELREVTALDSDTQRYKAIIAQTLVMSGSKSPDYLVSAAQMLEAVIPGARMRKLEGLDHNAPDENAPKNIAAVLKDFFV